MVQSFRLPNCKDDLAVQHKVLHSIVKEYQKCKNKGANSQIRKQGRKLNQAINISETLSKSSIAFQGPEQKQHVAREELSAILLRVEGYCLLSPGIIPKYSRPNCFSFLRLQLLPQEFTASCLAEKEYPQHFEIFLSAHLPRSSRSIAWFPLNLAEQCSWKYWNLLCSCDTNHFQISWWWTLFELITAISEKRFKFL